MFAGRSEELETNIPYFEGNYIKIFLIFIIFLVKLRGCTFSTSIKDYNFARIEF